MSVFYNYQDEQLSFHHARDEKPDPADFAMHTHDFCELFYFISGRGVFHIEGSEYPLHGGELLVMRQAEAHYIAIDPHFPYERAVVSFRESITTSVDPEGLLLSTFYDRDAGKSNLFNPSDFEEGSYAVLLQNMLCSMKKERLQLITNLFALLNELYHAAKSRDNCTEQTPESTAYQIISFLNAHLCDELSLDKICEHFFISKPQLCRSFKKATGSTVWDYITVKRLLQAKQLIQSGVSSTESALKCGFNDYSVFYRAYRKKFGCAPKKSILQSSI